MECMKNYDEKEYFESLGEEWEYKSDNVEVVHEFFYDCLGFKKTSSTDETLKLIRSILNIIYKRQEKEYKLERYFQELRLVLGGVEQENSKVIMDVIVNALYNVDVIKFEEELPSLTGYGKDVMESMNDLSDFELHYLSEIEYLFVKESNKKFLKEKKEEQEQFRERMRIIEEEYKKEEEERGTKDVLKTIKKLLKR